MDRTIGLIGAPTSAGAFAPGQEQAPRALRAAGLVERLTAAGVAVADHGDGPLWRWRPDRANPAAQNLGAVVAQVRGTAARVRAAVAAGHLPLVLGGDCTVGLGTIVGHLPTDERLGLVYFDLHPDLNLPTRVPTGTFDWMGMAHALGEEEAAPALARVGPRYPLLADDAVHFLAHDPAQATAWEREVQRRRGLRGTPVAEVAADPEGAAAAALADLEPRFDRLLVHFDVDVIDFTDAPLSENTRRFGGLPFDHALRALAVLAASPRFGALTVTELNPDHGEEGGSTLDRVVAALVGALAGALAGGPAAGRRARGTTRPGDPK